MGQFLLGEGLTNGLSRKLSSGNDGSPIKNGVAISEGELSAGVGVVDEEVDEQEIGERETGAKKKRPVARPLLVYERCKVFVRTISRCKQELRAQQHRDLRLLLLR